MNYFNLFSNILVTKGVKRILISDLQRDKSELFPLELYDIIEELRNESIEEVITSYDSEYQYLVNEYVEILIQNEFGFITQDSWDYNFPPLSYEFISPNEITNAYLQINDLNVLSKLNNSLSNLGTEHIVIHYNHYLKLEDFKFIEEAFHNSTVTSIEIFSLYNNDINENFFEMLDSASKRLYHIVLYACKDLSLRLEDKYKFKVTFVEENIQINSCGKIDLKYFNTNLLKVLEAKNYNSCLHKKISIDVEGNIRNCPSMPQSFGNIKDTTLEDALSHPDFKRYWNITKDSIEVCKDCEFRYICTDCRAYTEMTHKSEKGLDVSRPLKCGYNPYNNEWEEWSKNPLKKKAINYYGL